MATFLINTTVSTSTANASARTLAINDALLVDREGTLAGLGSNGNGLLLNGNNSVTVRGTIFGARNGINETDQSSGFHDIAVAVGALVSGRQGAISLASNQTAIDNRGEISGAEFGVRLTGNSHRIFNGGTVSSAQIAMLLDGGLMDVVNTGTIEGVFTGVTALLAGTSLVNHGIVAGVAGSGVELGSGGNDVINTGTISGGTGVSFFLGGTATNTLDNLGLIIGSNQAIFGSTSVEHVVNGGTLRGNTVLAGNDDFFDGRDGRQGSVLGDDGNDTLLGGMADDTLMGGAGADSLEGGVGNDIIRGGAGPDTMDGGVGSADIVDYAGSTAGVVVDLLNSATSAGDAAGDVITGFEWASGSSFGDVLLGDNAINGLFGGLGNDSLEGLGGNDRLVGGPGSDTLIGGVGADVQSGGTGNDIFRYQASAESTLPSRDRITDFASIAAGGVDRDRIDFSAIDAITGAGTVNDTFTFIGGAGFTAAGQIRIRTLGDLTYVSANMDANTATIELIIALNVTTFAAGDFIL